MSLPPSATFYDRHPDTSALARAQLHRRLTRLITQLDTSPVKHLREKHWQRDEDAFPAWLTQNAINGLEQRFPNTSARRRLTRSQAITFSIALGTFTIALFIQPIAALKFVASVTTLFFGLVVAVRIAACIHVLSASSPMQVHGRRLRIRDENLPVYTVLVPLFHEAKVLKGLISALTALDYPPEKLDIKLILESVDRETIAEAKALRLPRQFEIVVVPPSLPQTKPKALNFALQMAMGKFVVVYDAEDRPHPRQLRDSLATFASGPPNLACLQARLTIFNAAENWLTKQFAIEYGTLFRGLLPTFQALHLPVPLGGTSNHFRTAALKWLGGWDAFNVTEDADLGTRLYRQGYICQMLDSETREEAPCALTPWLKQRTRWLKGWMQTWLVQMRQPLLLFRKLGICRTIGFHAILGGVTLSALAHPVFWLLVLSEVTGLMTPELPSTILGLHIWLIAQFNIAMGFIASMLLSFITLLQTKDRFTAQILLMPFYWLLISLAAYRALYQLITRPFYWEKTEHGVSAMTHIGPHPDTS